MDNFFDVAVIGASNLSGIKILEVLHERNFPIKKLILFSDESTAVKKFYFNDKEIEILTLNNENVVKNRADIAFFCLQDNKAKKFAPLFSALGCTVIDTGSVFNLDDGVPLVIPSINPGDALLSTGIIACPDSLIIAALSILAPLHKKYVLKRVIYTCLNGDYKAIDNNIILKAEEALSNGYTPQEQKLIDEAKKILNDASLAVTATALNTPFYYGNSIAINARFSYACSVSDIIQVLAESEITVCNYPAVSESQNSSKFQAKRIRRDFSNPDTFNLLVTCDNITKGTALNAVQIAELII